MGGGGTVDRRGAVPVWSVKLAPARDIKEGRGMGCSPFRSGSTPRASSISLTPEVPSDRALAVLQIRTSNARRLLLPLVQQAHMLFGERVIRQ
ncbi:MAG: hypothetical protein RL685_4496 [Pseudomonadota bacterium]